MKVEFRTPVITDVRAIKPRAIYLAEPDHEQFLLRYEMSDMWTITLDEKPAAIVGVAAVWFGCAQVWAITSDDVTKAPVALTLALRRFLEEGAVQRRIHRVQMTVQLDFQAGILWAKALGFRQESVLENYGRKKEHYAMMVRFFT